MGVTFCARVASCTHGSRCTRGSRCTHGSHCTLKSCCRCRQARAGQAAAGPCASGCCAVGLDPAGSLAEPFPPQPLSLLPHPRAAALLPMHLAVVQTVVLLKGDFIKQPCLRPMRVCGVGPAPCCRSSAQGAPLGSRVGWGRGREDAGGPPSQNLLQGIARAAVLLLQLE